MGALLAIASATGCTVIVGADPPATFTCRLQGTMDPCRALSPPQRCVIGELGDGTCQPLACGMELCGNALDDDCDERIDEGTPEACNDADDDCDGRTDEGLDEDADSFTWCPTGPTALDCDDRNGSVRPGDASSEVCDGLDNDCSAATPDGFQDCESGTETCDPLAGGCVEISCRTRPELCASDQFCDATTSPPTCQPLDTSCFNLACTVAGERCNPTTGNCVLGAQEGSLCDHDSECLSNLCVPGAAIRASSDLGSSDGVCGTVCCSDADCSAGSTCWASGSGVRACVQDSLLEMGTHGAPTEEACSARSQCGEACRLTLDDAYDLADRSSMACGAPYAAPGPSCEFDFECIFDGYEACLDNQCGAGSCFAAEDCPEGICVGSGGIGSCREACGSTEDCSRGTSGGFARPGCRYILARSTAGRDDYVSFCSYSVSGTGTQGTTCTQDSDCRDFACVDAIGNPFAASGRTCADTCCNDDDCGAAQQCRPVFIHSHWESHCLPEPLFPPRGVRP